MTYVRDLPSGVTVHFPKGSRWRSSLRRIWDRASKNSSPVRYYQIDINPQHKAWKICCTIVDKTLAIIISRLTKDYALLIQNFLQSEVPRLVDSSRYNHSLSTAQGFTQFHAGLSKTLVCWRIVCVSLHCHLQSSCSLMAMIVATDGCVLVCDFAAERVQGIYCREASYRCSVYFTEAATTKYHLFVMKYPSLILCSCFQT